MGALVRRRGLVAAAALAAGLLLLAAGLALLERQASPAGLYVGRPPRLRPDAGQGLGVNVDLLRSAPEQRRAALRWARGAGFTWVRQTFLWAEIEPEPGRLEWSSADALIEAAGREELTVIAVLGGTPVWARPEGQEKQLWTPPGDVRQFGDFASTFAARYGQAIDFYQVWDQPNIYPYWGDQYVDASGYTQLLREGASRIRAADDQAWVLLAGLAPNVETGPLNLNEAEYLRQVYRAGGGSFFDIVAAKAYGFDSDADDRTADAGRLDFSRAALLRRVVEEEGQAWKPVWAVEYGWNSLPPGWQGRAAPWHSGAAAQQGERSQRAVMRARREWPWMGPMLWARLLPPADPADPAYGFALLEANLEPTALGKEVVPRLTSQAPERTGWQPPDSQAASYSGSWRVSRDGADPGGPGDAVEIRFSGTAIDLALRPGPFWGVWYVWVDGRPSPSLPNDSGRSYLVLYDPLGEPRLLTVARGLAAGEHVLRLEVQGGWEQWPLAGWAGWYEPAAGSAGVGPLLALGLALSLGGALVALRPPLLKRASAKLEAIGAASPAWLAAGLTFSFGAAFWLAKAPSISALLGAGLALCVFLWPSWAIAFAGAALPWFLVPKRVPGFQPSMTEVLAWLIACIQIGRLALAGKLVCVWRGRRRADWAVAALVALGAISLAVAGNCGVATTEFRRVVLSAALLYLAARLTPDRYLGQRVAAGLILGATLAALAGIWQAATGTGLIQADGVGRVRAAYGSPNNLALYLERVIPIAAAMALYSKGFWSRALYLVALALMLACGLLTRSRGLLLLGLPVTFAYLAWRVGSRRARLGLGLGLAVVAVAALLLGGARLRSLLTGQDEAAAMRLPLWRGTFNMIREHPLLGVGLDNFLYEYRTHYVLPEAWREPNLSHPHNLVLDFWTRLGLGGVALLAWLLASVWRATGRALAGPPGSEGVYRGIRAALLASLAHGFVDNFFFLVDLSHVLLLFLAVAANTAPVAADGEGGGRDGALSRAAP